MYSGIQIGIGVYLVSGLQRIIQAFPLTTQKVPSVAKPLNIAKHLLCSTLPVTISVMYTSSAAFEGGFRG